MTGVGAWQASVENGSWILWHIVKIVIKLVLLGGGGIVHCAGEEAGEVQRCLEGG